jgi:Tol biopolymer transport system component
MFVKILVKEWRENIQIFALALLMMAVMIILNLTGREEMTLYSSGMFLLLFLPLAALLLGSVGFYTEFKDNSWVYLFSRPVKKEMLWIFKFLSQLSILITVFVIFYFVRRLLPAVDNVFQDLNIDYPEALGEISLSVYIVMPLIAFAIAFSLSLLYDKQFIIFFVSILIGTGMMYFWQSYTYFLWAQGFYLRDEGIFSLFFTLSFVIASILTLATADFSQVGKKIFRFSTYVLIFLVLSFFISTVWVTRGQIFSSRSSFSVWHYQVYQGKFYFQDFRQGILRYDPDQEKIQRLNKETRFSFESFSLRAGKIAFFQIRNRGQWTNDLWIMNTDGTDARPLVESSKEDSLFYKKRTESFILSPDADRVAFITSHHEKEGKKNLVIRTLWQMKTDGTGLKSKILDVQDSQVVDLIFWPSFGNGLVLVVHNGPLTRQKSSKVRMVDLVERTSQTLVENIVVPPVYRLGHLHPSQEYLIFKTLKDDEDKESLVLLNLKTLETAELFQAELLKLWSGKWSPDGNQIAFSRGRELWIYNLEEKKIEKISQRNYEYEIGFDWTSDGQKFILLAPIDGENQLIIMDKNFQEIKTIKIPMQFKGAITVRGLENVAILKGSGKGSFWRVDLETEEWKKVY